MLEYGQRPRMMRRSETLRRTGINNLKTIFNDEGIVY